MMSLPWAVGLARAAAPHPQARPRPATPTQPLPPLPAGGPLLARARQIAVAAAAAAAAALPAAAEAKAVELTRAQRPQLLFLLFLLLLLRQLAAGQQSRAAAAAAASLLLPLSGAWRCCCTLAALPGAPPQAGSPALGGSPAWGPRSLQAVEQPRKCTLKREARQAGGPAYRRSSKLRNSKGEACTRCGSMARRVNRLLCGSHESSASAGQAACPLSTLGGTPRTFQGSGRPQLHAVGCPLPGIAPNPPQPGLQARGSPLPASATDPRPEASPAQPCRGCGPTCKTRMPWRRCTTARWR